MRGNRIIIIAAGVGLAFMVSVACGDPGGSTDSVQDSAQPQITATSTIEDLWYSQAKNNPVLQEQWVRRTLAEYGLENLFSEIIIVTPENADQYRKEYDRSKHLTPSSANLLTYGSFRVEDFGTDRAPLPRIYVPTEAFNGKEGDLEATLVFHEANHALVLRNGFEFGGIKNFEDKNKPDVYNASMLLVSYELEGTKEGLEKGSRMMSAKTIESNKQIYMSLYARIFGYEDIRDDVNEMLKTRYFQPWMRDAKSMWVYEDPDKNIKYGGKLKAQFFVPGKPSYIQFQFRQGDTSQNFKFPLPASIR